LPSCTQPSSVLSQSRSNAPRTAASLKTGSAASRSWYRLNSCSWLSPGCSRSNCSIRPNVAALAFSSIGASLSQRYSQALRRGPEPTPWSLPPQPSGVSGNPLAVALPMRSAPAHGMHPPSTVAPSSLGAMYGRRPCRPRDRWNKDAPDLKIVPATFSWAN